MNKIVDKNSELLLIFYFLIYKFWNVFLYSANKILKLKYIEYIY